jgi:hypothetical protein
MRLTSYRTFHKSIQRLRLLYEVTIHSYNVVFEQGRQSGLTQKSNAAAPQQTTNQGT